MPNWGFWGNLGFLAKPYQFRRGVEQLFKIGGEGLTIPSQGYSGPHSGQVGACSAVSVAREELYWISTYIFRN